MAGAAIAFEKPAEARPISLDFLPTEAHSPSDRDASAKRSGFQFTFIAGISGPHFPRSETCRAKGNHVRAPYAPELNTSETCADCSAEMLVIGVLPILFGDGYEDVTYKCNKCGAETTRAIKASWASWAA